VRPDQRVGPFQHAPKGPEIYLYPAGNRSPSRLQGTLKFFETVWQSSPRPKRVAGQRVRAGVRAGNTTAEVASSVTIVLQTAATRRLSLKLLTIDGLMSGIACCHHLGRVLERRGPAGVLRPARPESPASSCGVSESAIAQRGPPSSAPHAVLPPAIFGVADHTPRRRFAPSHVQSSPAAHLRQAQLRDGRRAMLDVLRPRSFVVGAFATAATRPRPSPRGWRAQQVVGDLVDRMRAREAERCLSLGLSSVGGLRPWAERIQVCIFHLQAHVLGTPRGPIASNSRPEHA